MIRCLIKCCAAMLLVAGLEPALAANAAPVMKGDAPSRYIVQKGDTLWDISGRFLDHPWLWPEVWEVNPHIKNPHLIYPGDEVYLIYRDGRPIIRVRRRAGRGVVRLSPSVRREPLDEAVPVIPVDAIQQFLRRPRVVTDSEFDAAPYIVSVGREALIVRPGEKFYVRGLGGDAATRFTVYRKGEPYVDPASGELLGFEALHVADAVLDRPGDPATLILSGVKREVLIGDRLVPVDAESRYQAYLPRAPEQPLEGQIISVVEGVSRIAQFQTVVINLGTRDGLEPGHVFAVYQRGETVIDPQAPDPVMEHYDRRARERSQKTEQYTPWAFVQGIGNAVESIGDLVGRERHRWGVAVTGEQPWAEVTLPDEPAGTILVYRPFERLSYGLVMEATRPMHVNDTIKNP